MSFDPHSNLSATSITVPPSPSNSGIIMQVADGTVFPSQAGFNAIVYQAGVFPNTLNTEIVRVININGNLLTVTRRMENSNARYILVGDIIAMTITAKVLTDIETAIQNSSGLIPANSNVNFVDGQLCLWDSGIQQWCPFTLVNGVLGVGLHL